MPSAHLRQRPEDFPAADGPRARFAARHLRLPAVPRELARAREYVSAAAAEFGLSGADQVQFVFAANEAMTNAIRHGRPDRDGAIWVEIVADGDLLTVTVSDFGSFVDRVSGDDPMAEGGRGFTFMTGLVDELALSTREGATTVRLSKRRGPSPEPERG